MDRNSEPVKFWHVCGPLLLYWVIQFVAQLVAELAVMIPHIGQVMDYDALEKSTKQPNTREARDKKKKVSVTGALYWSRMLRFIEVPPSLSDSISIAH